MIYHVSIMLALEPNCRIKDFLNAQIIINPQRFSSLAPSKISFLAKGSNWGLHDWVISLLLHQQTPSSSNPDILFGQCSGTDDRNPDKKNPGAPRWARRFRCIPENVIGPKTQTSGTISEPLPASSAGNLINTRPCRSDARES